MAATARDIDPSPRPNATLASVVFGAAALLTVVYGLQQVGLVGPWRPAWALKGAGILALAGYAALNRRPVLTLALSASAVGDVALALDPPQWVAGIGAFGLAHAFYIAIFLSWLARDGVRRATLPISVAVLIFAAAMLVWLGPDMGELRLPASLYIGIILVMAALALAAHGPRLVAFGALAFVASDSLIALEAFKGVDLGEVPWVWITYALAQLALAAGVVARPARLTSAR